VEKRAAPLALVGLTLLLFAPFWLQGRVFVPGDFTNFVYPWRAVSPPVVHNLDLFDTAVFFYPQDVFLNESLKAGDLPLWNPRIFCGHPMVASGQSALLYPPRLLAHWVLAPAVAKTLLLMLHTAGMGLAMYGWLKSRGLSDRGAGMGGLCWMLNAFTSSWMELDLIAYMGVYLPLMLWAIDRRHWPALAILGALTLHAGHLQMAFYVGLVVIFYAAWVIASTRAWRLVPAFLASGVAVLMMAAPTVLPFLELLKQSQRATFSFEALQRFSTSLGGMLLSLLNPDFLGNPSRGFAFNRAPANFPFYEYAAYIGLIPLAFAVLAVVRAGQTVWEQREIRAWGGLAVLSLLFATATPVYHLALLLLPVLNRALPGRFVLIFVFAGCVLAAHGFEIWCADQGARRGLAFALLPVSALTALAQVGFAVWLRGGGRAWLEAHRDGQAVKVPAYDAGPAYLDAVLEGLRLNYLWNPQLAMTVLAGLLAVYLVPRPKASLLAGFVALDLILFAQHFNTTMAPTALLPTTPSIRFLQEQPGLFRVEKESAAFYNLLYPYGLSLVTGYESLFPKRYSETMRKAQPQGNITMRSVAFTQFDSPILSAMNLAYLLQAPLDLKPPQGWTKVFDEDARVFSNPRVLPRVFVRGTIKPFRTFEQALAYLGSPEFDPALEAVTEQLLPGPVSPEANRATAEVSLYEPDRVAVQADLPAPGVLILADTFYPGWTCRDRNGQDLPIFPVNGTSRGVYLGQGRHELLFEFKPPRFVLGMRLCALGLVLSLLAAYTRRGR
jgi:hypothetical protein